MDVETVSDELYGLPLAEFTPARTVHVKHAKSAGDKDLAAQIHQLAKPNLVAWLANQLVREHADEIRSLLELGAGLRAATESSSGEQLRELSRQQRQLVHALVQHSRQLAKAAGRQVSSDTARDLEATLRAALADPDAAHALTAGRLTEGMHNSGFGSPASRDEHQPPSAEEPKTAGAGSLTARQDTPEQVKNAEHDRELAKSAADDAMRVRQRTHDLLEAADQRATDTQGRVGRLRRELDEALNAHSEAEKDQRRAQVAFERADGGARDAMGQLAAANERLGRLAQ